MFFFHLVLEVLNSEEIASTIKKSASYVIFQNLLILMKKKNGRIMLNIVRFLLNIESNIAIY